MSQKFATNFSAGLFQGNTHNSNKGLRELYDYISNAKTDNFCVFDVESVSRCLLQMAKGKAPAVTLMVYRIFLVTD